MDSGPWQAVLQEQEESYANGTAQNAPLRSFGPKIFHILMYLPRMLREIQDTPPHDAYSLRAISHRLQQLRHKLMTPHPEMELIHSQVRPCLQAIKHTGGPIIERDAEIVSHCHLQDHYLDL